MRWSIPTKMIEEGRQLVNQDRVLKVIPNENEAIWRAEVLDDEKYIVILDGTGKEEDICRCITWQQKSYCPHTVAVELFLRDHDVVRAMAYSKKPLFHYPENVMDQRPSIDKLLTSYRERMDYKLSDQDQVKTYRLKVQFEIYDMTGLQYQLSSERLFYLRLKVGYDQLYYVQDFTDFYRQLLNAGSYRLSNRHDKAVWLIKEAFNADTYDLLYQLALIKENNNHRLEAGLNISTSHQSPQRDFLSQKQLSMLIDFYQEHSESNQDGDSIQFYLDDELVELNFYQDKRPVLLELQHKDGNYLVIMNPRMRLYKFYQMIFDGYNLYKIEADQSYFDDLELLQGTFADHTYQWQLSADEVEEFISCFGYQILAHGLINNIVLLSFASGMGPLKVEIALDVSDRLLQANLIYHYGQYQLSDTPGENILPEKGIILRDIKGEIQSEQQLIKLAFEKSDNQFISQFDNFNQTMEALNDCQKFFPDEWTVTYSQQLEEWQNNDKQLKVETGKNEENRFLTINFTLDDVDDDEVNEILKAIEQNDQYLQLDSGKIIDLKKIITPQQNKMLKQLRSGNTHWENGGQVPAYQSLKYADALGQAVDFEQFYQDIIHPARSDYQSNPGLKTELAPYQKYAVQWLGQLAKYNLGGLLADEMGLGKTVQTVAFLLDYFDKLPQANVLILAPASVIYNWKYEIQRFAPEVKVVVLDGSVEEREKIRKENPKAIWICSYHSYRNDQEAYHQEYFDVLILDEAQALKNERTVLYQSVVNQDSGMRIGLSGTPLENNLNEFWALMQMILPGLLPQKKEFQAMSIENIRKLVSPFVLRRTKQEVQLELPDKSVHNRYASLESNQKAVYLAYLEDIRDRLKDNDVNGSHKHMEMLAAITRLRQICCHPALVNSDYQGTSGKFEYFKRMLERALSNNRRILVFSQFTSMLAIMQDYLDQEAINSFIIEGKTNKEKRQDQVNRFNQGEGSVFLISLRAGGVGINLTGADTVFLYDLWWNPSVEEQAIGRAHRIGQTKDVEVYRFITEGTIEERIAELQEEKRHLFDELFQDEEMGESSHLTMDDLRFILDMPAS
ncbi:DEAD/DEAH box helicase [Aerococcus mictus]|uniref:DEAD/DEAH box helicase n=1 Tax=Aerococcus mictus TaxID=2976810 RepID=UPI0012452316|nr:DEAD/DEAH box helicase [Aerococcus mictus]KAA9233243.1 DEAD/DEAH box helicase [Aerococcus mictus]